jgi:hypothetical protein
MNSERKQRLKTLWHAGEKAEVIAAELGVTYETIRINRRRLGLPARGHGGCEGLPVSIPLLSTHKIVRAHMLWRNGMDTLSIASALHSTEPEIYNSLSNYREALRKGITP